MLIANILLVLTSVILAVLMAVVFVSNPGKRLNQVMTFFLFSQLIWVIANVLTNTAADQGLSLLFARATLIGATLIPLSFLWFVWVYAGSRVSRLKFAAFSLLPILILLTTPTELNIVSVDAYGESTVTGPIYLLLIIEFIIYFAVALYILGKKYSSSSANRQQKQQIKYIYIGVFAALIPGFLTNGLLPLFGSSEAVFYGPTSTVFLAIFTSTAIFKHGFLDIRLVVARSLGYVLSIASLSLVYGFLAFNVINQFIFGGENIDFHQRFIYTILAVVIAFTFQPLKAFFDKWTNRIFYRDAYDSQVLLDKLNKTLVSTIELDRLLTGVSTVIADTIKTEFCVFGIKEMEGTKQRIIGTEQKVFDKLEVAEVRSITPTLKTKSIITDELDEEHGKLRTILRKNDIAVLVRLTDTPNKKAEGLGYILLGAKKSGSPYSRQDIKVMEIIADELVIAIQNALRFEEIKNFNITLQEKVDDATRQLRRTNEKLKQLDQTKDDFISMASHQLRTPLTSIKGYVSMVMEGDAGKITKQQTKLLDQAFISSQRMVYLIADLLNVSRLKTGKFIIEPKATNLAEVIEGELSQLTETAKGRDLELSYDKPKDFPELMLDETKTRQVIMNFVDNAIYYTPAGGHIKVAVRDTGDAIEFTVTDDGIGVPKSEQHHLFTKFYRAGNAKKARPDGTGLGLFMAKKVIVAQGGSIIFKTQEGKGSTFGFSFAKKPLLPENFKGVIADEKDAK